MIKKIGNIILTLMIISSICCTVYTVYQMYRFINNDYIYIEDVNNLE